MVMKPLPVEVLRQRIMALSQPVRKALRSYMRETFGIENEEVLADKICEFMEKVDFYTLLESKIPVTAALVVDDELSDEVRIKLISNPLHLNDSEHALASAVKFGYNLIHVNDPQELGRVLKIVRNL
jgi:hypothetical protein